MTTEPVPLLQLQEYEANAWTQVVLAWTPDLYSYLCYTLPTKAAVEEVLVETFQAFVELIPACTTEVPLNVYFYSTAYRKVADYWRRSPSSFLLPPSPKESPFFSIPPELSQPFAELTEFAQQVLILRYQVGVGLNELAEILGRSRKATESLLSRARSQWGAALTNAGQPLSDEEFFDLFQRKLPRLPLPADLRERIQQHVLTQIQTNRNQG